MCWLWWVRTGWQAAAIPVIMILIIWCNHTKLSLPCQSIGQGQEENIDLRWAMNGAGLLSLCVSWIQCVLDWGCSFKSWFLLSRFLVYLVALFFSVILRVTETKVSCHQSKTQGIIRKAAGRWLIGHVFCLNEIDELSWFKSQKQLKNYNPRSFVQQIFLEKRSKLENVCYCLRVQFYK